MPLTNRLLFSNNSGNVGIGTTAPDVRFHVVNSSAESIFARFQSTGASSAFIGFAGTGATTNYHVAAGSPGPNLFAIKTDDTERLRVNATGNVGIGTTAPAEKLHVYGGVYINNSTGGGSIRIGDPAIANYSNQYQYINFGGDTGGQDGWQIGKKNNTADVVGPDKGFYIYDLKNSAARFVIDTSGNVGIGTTNPSYKLDVQGPAGTAIVARLSSNSDNNQLRFYGGSSAAELIAIGTNVADGGNGANFDVYNLASSANLIRVRSDGSFVVGDTANYNVRTHIAGVGNTTSTGTGSSNIILALRDTTAGAQNVGAGIAFLGNDGSNTGVTFATINGRKENSTSANYASYLEFKTRAHAGNLTERLRITSSGSIGIGVTDPLVQTQIHTNGLNIAGGNAIKSSTMAGLMVTNTNNDNSSVGIWFGTNQAHWTGISSQRSDYTTTWGTDLRFYTHEDALTDLTYARERMRINQAGIVGIGTITDALPSGARLIVKDISANDGTDFIGVQYRGTAGNHESGFKWYDFRGQVNASIVNSLQDDGVGTQAAHLAFKTATGGTLSERVRITNDGNLLVGTTSNTDGRVNIKTGSALSYSATGYNGTSANLRLSSGGSPTTGTTTGIAYGVGGNSEYYIGAVQQSSGYADLVFQSFNGSYGERVRITASGDVGIGITPRNGDGNLQIPSTGAIAFGNANSTLNAWMSTGSYNYSSGSQLAISTQSSWPITFGTSNTERMRITSTGDVGIGTTSPAFTSGTGVEIQRSGTATLRLDSGTFATELRGYSDGTGLFQLSAGYLDLGTDSGGTTRLRITSTGNVGIGTTSPSGRLHVTAPAITAAAPSLGWPVYNAEADTNSKPIYFDTAGNGSVATAGQGATVALVLGQYYDSRVVITPTGNGGASPGDQGQGRGKDLMLKAGTSDNGVGFKGGRLYLSGGMGYTATGYDGNVGDILMQPFTAAGGNVGIGTTAPGEKLDVNGNIKATGFRTIQLVRSLGTTVNSTVEIGNWNLGNGAHTFQVFVTASLSGYSVTKSYIVSTYYDQTSNNWRSVGPISNPGPYTDDFALEIKVDQYITYLRLRKTLNSTYGGNHQITIIGLGEPTDTFTATSTTGTDSSSLSVLSSTPIAVKTGNVGIGTINPSTALDVNGTATATTFNSTSDARLKENFEAIPDPLQKLAAIRGLTYNFRDDERQRRHAGILAQDLLEVLPEAVSGSEDTNYTVGYNNVVALLVEAVKELKAEVDRLKKNNAQH